MCSRKLAIKCCTEVLAFDGVRSPKLFTMNNTKEWQAIPGASRYEVTRDGRVRCTQAPYTMKNGIEPLLHASVRVSISHCHQRHGRPPHECRRPHLDV